MEPKRIMQTELGPKGNCQSACLAMMLGCDLEAVPNFNELYGHDADEYAKQLQSWLMDRGLWIITFIPWQGVPWPPRHGYYIAGGTSARDLRHAVIYKDGRLWHDPHPDGIGIEEVTDFDLILPLDFRPALTHELTPRLEGKDMRAP